MTDDELYHQYLSGDPSAGDQLMLRYGNQLTAYLDAFLHNVHDAEDLMLDCFAVILVNKPKIRDGSFPAYLFRVARNKANRLWRIRLRRTEFRLDETLISGEAAPEEYAEKSERNTALYRCLNQIAPQYREALWLVYIDGMSYAQAAQVMGCNLTKIENLLKNGKNRLRQELEKEGITRADI